MKLLGLAALPLAAAAPLEKRQTTLSEDDISVLQLAHYLENLEFNLYTGGFDTFTEADYEADGFPAGFRDGVGVTASVWIPSQTEAHRVLGRQSNRSAKLTQPPINSKKQPTATPSPPSSPPAAKAPSPHAPTVSPTAARRSSWTLPT